jgi:DNA-binding transcriptional LysR family regulator
VSDTDDMAIFVRIIELGSLSAAGRDMRLSPAVVSNRVARLEGSLGVRLLNRTTRRVSPTEEGATFYEHCLSILNELEQAESVISERLTACCCASPARGNIAGRCRGRTARSRRQPFFVGSLRLIVGKRH